MKLASQPGGDAQALEAVAAYTQAFNKMGFIETEERDEIYMALRDSGCSAGRHSQKDALIEQFKQLRDFEENEKHDRVQQGSWPGMDGNDVSLSDFSGKTV